MAKINGLEKLSYAELAEVRNRVDRLMVDTRNSARDELRKNVATMLKDHGLSIQDLFGKGRKGAVAVKYRDPKNPENAWTGRGRMPRWLVAAMPTHLIDECGLIKVGRKVALYGIA